MTRNRVVLFMAGLCLVGAQLPASAQAGSYFSSKQCSQLQSALNSLRTLPANQLKYVVNGKQSSKMKAIKSTLTGVYLKSMGIQSKSEAQVFLVELGDCTGGTIKVNATADSLVLESPTKALTLRSMGNLAAGTVSGLGAVSLMFINVTGTIAGGAALPAAGAALFPVGIITGVGAAVGYAGAIVYDFSTSVFHYRKSRVLTAELMAVKTIKAVSHARFSGK